jgi:Flp pilus assembly protein TadG
MLMVALLMVVIVGMAAFAIDGSNMHSQHRRLQADLDVALKSGAACSR